MLKTTNSIVFELEQLRLLGLRGFPKNKFNKWVVGIEIYSNTFIESSVKTLGTRAAVF
jgi:hypothetical protein